MARATTALNIIQRVGGSVGTALLSVVLAHQLSSRLPSGAGESGLGAAQAATARARDLVAPQVAEAFGHTFYWGLGILALAVIPALMLPRHRPAATAGAVPAEARAEAEAVAA